MITRDDTKGIDNLKKYLQKQFQTKVLGSLNYFLGIKVGGQVQEEDSFVTEQICT